MITRGGARSRVMAAMLLSVPLAAQTPESGKVYPAASTVNLAEFAVTFQVPQGWTAAAQDQPGALLLANADRSVIGFLFLKSGASESEIKGFLSESAAAISRMEQGPLAGFDQAWSFDFRDTDLDLDGTGRAVIGPSATAAIVLLMATGARPASLSGAAEQWIRALRFAGGQPQAKVPPGRAQPPKGRPASPFTGRHIHAFKSYSGGDYFESTRINLDLCSDGTYAAVVKKESSSVSGVLPPSQTVDRETGTWSISGSAPRWTLTLRPSEGVPSTVSIGTANGFKFGDMPAESSPSVNCR